MPLMRCKIESTPGSGRRILTRLRYFGRLFISAVAESFGTGALVIGFLCCGGDSGDDRIQQTRVGLFWQYVVLAELQTFGRGFLAPVVMGLARRFFIICGNPLFAYWRFITGGEIVAAAAFVVSIVMSAACALWFARLDSAAYQRGIFDCGDCCDCRCAFGCAPGRV